MKTLFIIGVLLLNCTPALAAARWVKMGVTSDKQTMWLDINSIQQKPRAAYNWRWFNYRLNNRIIRGAYTDNCTDAGFGDGRLYWFVNDRKIFATSKAGVNLVERVCK